MGEEEAVPIRNMLACGDTCVLSRASLEFAASLVCLSKRGLWLLVSFVGEVGHGTSATSTPCTCLSRHGEAEGGRDSLLPIFAFPPGNGAGGPTPSGSAGWRSRRDLCPRRFLKQHL